MAEMRRILCTQDPLPWFCDCDNDYCFQIAECFGKPGSRVAGCHALREPERRFVDRRAIAKAGA